MSSYDWPAAPATQEGEITVPKQSAPAAADDPFADLEVEIVPAVEPASPTALKWLDAALASTEKKQRGRVAPVTTEEKYNLVRAALRRAATERKVTVICSEETDKDDNLVALTFTINKRRGAKTE